VCFHLPLLLFAQTVSFCFRGFVFVDGFFGEEVGAAACNDQCAPAVAMGC
jgi:hypothetical protein